MNDPKRPYHAKSYYTFDGLIPFQCGRPPDEEDFETLAQARQWLQESGGGIIQRCCNHCQHFSDIETVKPEGSMPGRPAIHSSRRVKHA